MRSNFKRMKEKIYNVYIIYIYILQLLNHFPPTYLYFNSYYGRNCQKL